MIEGSGHVPMHLWRHGQATRILPRGAVLYARPLTTDIAPGYDHITSAIAAMIGWFGTAMLCYVTPKSILVCPTVTMSKPEYHLQNRSPCGRPRQRSPAPTCGTTLCPSRSEFRWRDGAQPDPETAMSYHDSASRRGACSHICSMCGPKFCSMKITQEIRDLEEAKSGMAQKSEEFRSMGSEIYHKQ